MQRPKVAVLSPNSLEMAIGIMAIHAGGFWLIPLNPRDAAAEVERQVELAKPDLFILDPALAEGFKAQALIELVRQALGPVKTPKAIHILNDLPRSVVGKVQRREVRDLYLPKA